MGARSCRHGAAVGVTLLGCLACAVACRTPLGARKDAGRPTDAAGADSAVDLAADFPVEVAPPDLSRSDLVTDGPPDGLPEDLLAPDLAPPALVPRAFRLVNHTSRIAYVDGNTSVACRRDTPAGWEYCSFFGLGCLFPCNNIPSNGDCRVQCEQPEPALVPIAPGASYVVPWKGRTYAMTAGACTAGQCQQETVVQSAGFEASALVFADFACGPLACQSTADGVIRYANPLGGSVAVTALFNVPYDRDEVVLDITSLPVADAGAAPDLGAPDLTAPDLPRGSDSARDGFLAPFADLPGHTFEITAATTVRDAGFLCPRPDPAAVYHLTFSDDGATVTIIRQDPVQEQIMRGSLQPGSGSTLTYDLEARPAGGELVVRSENGGLTAYLALFGSGLPIIWCIESPMTPA